MTWQRILVDGRLQLRFVPQLEFKLPPYLFDQQLAICQACVHYLAKRSTCDDHGQICVVAGAHVSCSLRRLPGELCGPEACCFEPARCASVAPPRTRHLVVGRWSAADVQHLRAGYADKPADTLAVACRKTVASIYRKASQLGLSKAPSSITQAARE